MIDGIVFYWLGAGLRCAISMVVVDACSERLSSFPGTSGRATLHLLCPGLRSLLGVRSQSSADAESSSCSSHHLIVCVALSADLAQDTSVTKQ